MECNIDYFATVLFFSELRQLSWVYPLAFKDGDAKITRKGDLRPSFSTLYDAQHPLKDISTSHRCARWEKRLLEAPANLV